ncbi:hypothetical protein B0H14DRAFT_2568219 [Mycena olivaceomarginata]|nr:hypothetical protein B0H14DRAFT_2568219 [Mycena olivaceomarginata]
MVANFVGNDSRTLVCIEWKVEGCVSSRKCSRTVSGRRVRIASSSAIAWRCGGENVGGRKLGSGSIATASTAKPRQPSVVSLCRDLYILISPSYDALRELLDPAPSLSTRGWLHRLVLHECCGGRRLWLWDEEYMDEVFSALIAIIADHGTGEDGWMNARWEVYDTCVSLSPHFFAHLHGLNYRGNRWYDDAGDWLRGRMELPEEQSVTIRQDNKFGEKI